LSVAEYFKQSAHQTADYKSALQIDVIKRRIAARQRLIRGGDQSALFTIANGCSVLDSFPHTLLCRTDNEQYSLA
jgi:hypothetical protein